MLGIPNPMPKRYHYRTTDIDVHAQQDLLMRNTLPYIARSIEASRTTVLAIQHLRIIDTYNEYINFINCNYHDQIHTLPLMWYNPLKDAPFQATHMALLKIYCFMGLYGMTHAAIEEAVTNLTEEIQTFLLNIGQESYTIPLINGLRWQIKMTPDSLNILKHHKYTVAHRRYIKRRRTM